MENQISEEAEDVSPINLNEEIQYYLYETAKWAKFLSIVGFVFAGFMLLAAFSMTAVSNMESMQQFTAFPGGIKTIAFVYGIMAVVYFFPTLYLYRFSTNAKSGINFGNEAQLTEAFANLKSVYKFWGIMTLIFIIFYILILIATIAGLGFMTSISR